MGAGVSLASEAIAMRSTEASKAARHQTKVQGPGVFASQAHPRGPAIFRSPKSITPFYFTLESSSREMV